MMSRSCSPEMMKRGGKKRKSKKAAVQQQVVNVKVKVGDTVQLMRGQAPQQRIPMGNFRLLQGVGAKFASEPFVLKSDSYGIAPASTAPMYDYPVKVGGGAQYNANQQDDVRIITNPKGIEPQLQQSKKLVPAVDMYADRRVNYDYLRKTAFEGETPSANQQPVANSSRAVASQPSTGWLMTHDPRMRAAPSTLGAVLGAAEAAAKAASASSSSLFNEDEPDLPEVERDPLDRTGLPPVAGELYGPMVAGLDYTGVPYKVNKEGRKIYLRNSGKRPGMRRDGSVF